jgi:hypothetical protein
MGRKSRPTRRRKGGKQRGGEGAGEWNWDPDQKMYYYTAAGVWYDPKDKQYGIGDNWVPAAPSEPPSSTIPTAPPPPAANKKGASWWPLTRKKNSNGAVSPGQLTKETYRTYLLTREPPHVKARKDMLFDILKGFNIFTKEELKKSKVEDIKSLVDEKHITDFNEELKSRGGAELNEYDIKYIIDKLDMYVYGSQRKQQQSRGSSAGTTAYMAGSTADALGLF